MGSQLSTHSTFNMDYDSIKEDCLRKGKLFEDPEFPAVDDSIYRDKEVDSSIVWRRPKEIHKDAVFIRGQASRFDFDQGELGDCWFVAAAAALAAQNQQLLYNIIIPEGQSFKEGEYAGIFRFRFWRFGRWTDVIIDDRLPYSTEYQELAFTRNREEPDEFWVALMEKAYAKLHDRYEGLEGGKIQDAFVDFTGGISEFIDLQDKKSRPDNLFDILEKTHEMNSMMGCSISKSDDDDSGQWEQEHDNGLYSGHAYSITGIARVKTDDRKRHRLIRLRNPWGKCEWNGKWGDKTKNSISPMWNMVDEHTKEEIGFQSGEDGEFWMSFEDWLDNFTECQMCHHSPNSLTAAVAKEKGKRSWQEMQYSGSWQPGISAGGCGNPPDEDKLYTNPQYHVTLDDEDGDGECMLIISLMEEFKWKRDIAIGFYIFKVKDRSKGRGKCKYASRDLEFVATGTYSYYREVTLRFNLEPGEYVIIPSSFNPGDQADFMLRIFTEKKPVRSRIVDVRIGRSKERAIAKRPSREWEDSVAKLFDEFAGEDGEIDAYELQKLLNYVFFRGEVVVTGGVYKRFSAPPCLLDYSLPKPGAKEDEEANFDRESARSLLAMVDDNRSGKICRKEFSKLTTELKVWKDGFHKYDRDGSGTIDVSELQEVFARMGFDVPQNVLIVLVRRYGNKNQTLNFRDFILASTKLMIMYLRFVHRSNGFTDETTFKMSLEQFLVDTIYC